MCEGVCVGGDSMYGGVCGDVCVGYACVEVCVGVCVRDMYVWAFVSV